MAFSRQPRDSYLTLVKQFPLVVLRDRRQLQEALSTSDGLLKRRLDRGAEEYLDVLSELVSRYEDEHEPIPDASEAEVLGELIRSSGISQTMIAKQVGISQSTLSAVLNGTRELTKSQVILLARRFNVSPGAFLQQ